jgi:hypothetical protein
MVLQWVHAAPKEREGDEAWINARKKGVRDSAQRGMTGGGGALAKSGEDDDLRCS